MTESYKDEKPNIIEKYGDDIRNIQFSSHVVGSTFYSSAQEIIKLLKKVPSELIILRFEREPDNEFDPYAVAIYVSIVGAKREYMIGHFPKEGSHLISYVLSHDKEYKLIITNARVCGGAQDPEFYGLFFDFKIFKI